ncbi:MAG: hypothetical protein EZS28_005374 [Streblomastix strix]|uniref:DNA-directed DNA polymerase n=1 Tax=Streblomastix strix TaxID=222440 RepID=A0A5J4WXY3_9EUKA|nr:MAG: hypothetical protein EZS28_005374 [Streblomastix strix]
MQNQEMTQKIRKYKGQHVEEIQIENKLKLFEGTETRHDDQTLLLFPPIDEAKFIDRVRRARKGFLRKREIVKIDGVSPSYYDNYIDSLDAIDMHVEFVYSEQGHRAFEILFNFGVIIEELEHDKNGQEIFTYKYRLPRKDTAQTHVPKNIQSHDDIEEYKQYVRAEIIEMQNFNLENTKQRYVAIYSMMIKDFKLQKKVAGTSMQELIQKQWQGHRQILFKNNSEYNMCYMEAIAKALHPGTPEKRYMPNNIISLAREYLIKVLDLPLKENSKQMTKYLKTFEGLDYQKYSQIITQKLLVNQNIYFYDEDSKAYYQGQKIIYMYYDILQLSEQSEIPTVDILIVQASNLQHAFVIANQEALTGLKFCPFCQVKGLDIKNSNYSRDYEKHIVKYEQRGGKLVKTIQLDQVQKPYVSHIVQNKTFAYLLAHGREQEFKPTQNYIMYDLETVEKIVNTSFGKSSKQISDLVPLSVASTIKNKAGVRTIYYDLRNENVFIKQWFKMLSYEVQDKCQKRDTTDNVQKQDFEYFKQLFKDSKCAICGDEFAMNNKPTLDRINDLKGHSKYNVQPLSDNVYVAQMNPEKCKCNTPIQVAYFVLDNAKYWYLNFIYNFMYKCFDMDKLHFIEGDTDSAYWAVSGNKSESYKQQFKHVKKDQQFYNENAKYFFPNIEGDLLNEKKILGLAIEREGTEKIALAPKNYYIKAQRVDNITEGTITKCINMRLGQKSYQMSKLAIEKKGITGCHTKAVVLSNQSCCPIIFGLKAKNYSFKKNSFQANASTLMLVDSF